MYYIHKCKYGKNSNGIYEKSLENIYCSYKYTGTQINMRPAQAQIVITIYSIRWLDKTFSNIIKSNHPAIYSITLIHHDLDDKLKL